MNEHCGHVEAPGERGPEASTFALPGATEHYAPDRPVLAERIRLELHLDFDRRALRGTCATLVRAVREVTSLAFDAVGMEFEGATVDGEPAGWANSGGQVWVTPRQPLAANAAAEVLLHYRCQPSRGLWFIGPDDAYPDRPLQAWTQGADVDARHWFPCLDSPAQRAQTEVLASFPAGMTALSNGELVSDEVLGDRRTVHYRFRFPHAPYLVTLVVGELEETRDTIGGVLFRYLYPKGRKDDALRAVGRTPEMMKLFGHLLGEQYPFGSYSQVFVHDFLFGAMENTTATTLSDTLLHDSRAQLDSSAERTVAHELAHQWFGDLLTCRDWAHGWLNEGFATYFEVLWKEHAEGQDEADQLRREQLDEYLKETRDRYARPLVARRFHAPIELFDRHLYQKGALVLHELRRRLKDGLFFKALREYVARHAFHGVETVDLARALESSTGHNLDRFFDQYVYAPGHPRLEVEVHYEGEEGRVQLRVRQKQDPATGAPLFRLPLEVVLTVNGVDYPHTVAVNDAEHLFYLPCALPPTQIRVDPRRDVLGTLLVRKPIEYWIEELQRAEEARARTEAALALGRDGSRRAVDALSATLVDEGFWATQAAIAQALGMARLPRAKRALLDNLGLPHPKARRAVVAALGEYRRDAEAREALERLCQRGDESYFVEAEAARSLGKLRLPDALPVLMDMLSRKSFQDVIAVGAIEGMAESLDPAAYDVLAPLTRYGQPPFVRRAAVVALAKLAEPAQKKREAGETLSELLRDPAFRVQQAAIEAAKTLGDKRLLPVLESTPFGDGRVRRAAREAVRAMREDEPYAREVAALREEVDRLKEEARQIKERLEAMSAQPGRPAPAPEPQPAPGPATAPRATGRKAPGRTAPKSDKTEKPRRKRRPPAR